MKIDKTENKISVFLNYFNWQQTIFGRDRLSSVVSDTFQSFSIVTLNNGQVSFNPVIIFCNYFKYLCVFWDAFLAYGQL